MPWQFDRSVVHNGHANTYTLTKDGVCHKLKPLKEVEEKDIVSKNVPKGLPSGRSNEVADAFSRRQTLLTKMQLEKVGFTKEAIVEVREKHAGQQEKPVEIKEKPVETKKEKPLKIQFQRKGKIVEPPTAPIKAGKRKKQQAHKPVDIDEEETEPKGEKKALRASGKRSKGVGTPTAAMKQDREYIEYFLKNLQPEATEEELDEIIAKAKSYFRLKKRLTRMLIGETQSIHEETEQILKKVPGMISDEEEEVKEDEPERFEAEDLLKGVKMIDFKPDEIMLDNQPVNTQTKPEIIPDDDDTSDNDDASALDNVNV
ncbi:uncharacterized protein LOC131874222 [Cryptomeria japonica]|uniref:uncharacterized protein LOC131874222 n=1 Tax=Cryptomeria japonica TaxID=3369 RepID=UPI0027DA0255|nr:uncharacterized protein LOC131874222 [Cryptomeria japonica]